MGHLIPAGTGLPAYRNLKIDTLGASNEKLSLEEAAERIEGVATPQTDLLGQQEGATAAPTAEMVAEDPNAPAATTEDAAPAGDEEEAS